jgi:hypothetical protein
MKNPFIVKPTGLKGNEKLNRMRELMGTTSLNEDVKNSVVELTKLGPDGKVYGIVREGHNYFIKVTNKQSNIVTEDFNYIGGLMNKTSEAYPTYAKAIKQLNLKFNSLNEAYGKSGQVNVFKDDNLLTEGFYDAGMAEYDKPAMASFKKQYGDEKGKSIYYATANKQDRDPETFEKNEGLEPNDDDLSPLDRMYDSDDWVRAQRDAMGYDDTDVDGNYYGDDEDVLRGGDSRYDGYESGIGLNPDIDEAELSHGQEKIAKLAGDPNKIDADDLAALRAGKKSDEGYMDEIEMSEYEMAIDEMIEESKEEMSDKEKKFAALAEPKDKITYADKIAGAKKGDEESDDDTQNESIVDEMEALLEASDSLLKKKL